jgi:hypothetical protein
VCVCVCCIYTYVYLCLHIDKHCFRILTNDTSYQCRALNERDCMRWHAAILHDLQSLHEHDEWLTKMKAARELAENLKKLFDYELARYTLLCFRVANAGMPLHLTHSFIHAFAHIAIVLFE